MKKHFLHISLPVLVAVLGMALAQESPAGSPEAGNEGLLAADKAWSESVDDSEAFLSFFADDALFMPADAPLVQGDGIRETWEHLTANPGFALEWTATGAEVAQSGELGYTVGTFSLVLDHDGVLMVTHGKYLTAWGKQEDGSWKVKVDTFNADGPPVPQEQP